VRAAIVSFVEGNSHVTLRAAIPRHRDSRGVLGFGGVAGAGVVIARILFLLFLILFVLSLLIERCRGFQ
jgi:uncharacterized membrane protein YtjA (UPF0391 family)